MKRYIIAALVGLLMGTGIVGYKYHQDGIPKYPVGTCLQGTGTYDRDFEIPYYVIIDDIKDGKYYFTLIVVILSQQESMDIRLFHKEAEVEKLVKIDCETGFRIHEAIRR